MDARPPIQPPTQAERAYRALRGDILGGHHRPGSRLAFADLGRRYGASQGVLREALSRLAAEGLVESVPQLGFRVRSISVDDLDDLTATRCDIEGLALRYAIEHGDLEWETGVVAALHRLERTDAVAGGSLNPAWVAAHSQLHTALIEGCPGVRLRRIAQGLRDSAEIYRQWSMTLGADGRRDVGGEHRRIVEAALARRADEAVAELAAHLRATRDQLLPSLIAPITGTDP